MEVRSGCVQCQSIVICETLTQLTICTVVTENLSEIMCYLVLARMYFKQTVFFCLSECGMIILLERCITLNLCEF